MKRILINLMLAASVMAATVSCSCNGQKQQKEKEETMAFDATNLSDEPVFIIRTDMGDIKVRLYKETPKHRDNFVKLASEGFYDGILFHRVINGFMIQTGDPLTKNPDAPKEKYGTGGPGYNVPAEFVQGLTHKKGALAAARRGDAANPMRESSGSQFYIVQDEEACSHLDGQYTIFGETLEGFDVIDRIAAVQTDGRDRPLKDVHIISIRPDMLPDNSGTDTASMQNDSLPGTK